MAIHNLCASCKQDFYTMEDWDAHRKAVRPARGVEPSNTCIPVEDLPKLNPPMFLEGDVWSTREGHALRLRNTETMTKVRASRGKKQKVAS